MKKSVVITGCTRGLGLAMLLEFSRRGWTVSGCGTHTDSVDSLAKELGNNHLVLPCDVTDPAAVTAFATATLNVSGAPDLLINNAAVVNHNAPLWKVPVVEFSRLIDVNIKGIHHVCCAFLPAMIARGCGVIVNLSSVGGDRRHRMWPHTARASGQWKDSPAHSLKISHQDLPQYHSTQASSTLICCAAASAAPQTDSPPLPVGRNEQSPSSKSSAQVTMADHSQLPELREYFRLN